MRVVLRLLGLLAVLARHGVGHLVGRPKWADGPTRLRLILEDAGGTWLKFGQVLSLQPDVLPRAYCNALFDLLDRVPPFDFASVERVILDELGRLPDEIFDRFEREPIAAASIGQVHQAEIDGCRVAVKVQRPDVHRSFEADLQLMVGLQQLITLLRLERLDWLGRAIDEFVDWTREELDYRTEARFMAALGHNAKDNPSEAIPELVPQLSTKRVLVAEFLDGPVLVDYLRAIEAGHRRSFESDRLDDSFDRDRLARSIIRNFVSDAFHHGLFHADLHPANLLILPNGVVGYVDFGITGSLSAFVRRNIVGLTLALARADLDAMMRHYLRIAMITDESDIDEYRRKLADHLGRWFDLDRERPLLRTSFSRIMLDMLALGRQTDLIPGPDTIRYLRSVITAEGLISRFEPEFDVSGYLEEVCEDEFRRQRWRDWLSSPTLAEWTSGGIELASRAPAALADWLRGAATRPERGGTRSRLNRHQIALRWGLLSLVFSVIAVAAGPATPGVNLFTAGAAACAAAVTMFVRSLRRAQ